MDFQPVGGQAFQARDLVTDFVVENFGASTGDGVESGIAQAGDRVAHTERAVFGDRENFGCRVAMEMNFWKALLDAAEHLLVPVDLEVGVEASLHEDTGAAEFDGLADFLVDGVEIEDVAFFRGWALSVDGRRRRRCNIRCRNLCN